MTRTGICPFESAHQVGGAAPPPTILIDTREQQYVGIALSFERLGYAWQRRKLDVGDYALDGNSSIVVERKGSLAELAATLSQAHARFVRELRRALQSGIKVHLLIVDSEVQSLAELAQWTNPRLAVSPRAVTGQRMAQRLGDLAERFNISITFCQPSQAGKKIIQLLTITAAQAA